MTRFRKTKNTLCLTFLFALGLLSPLLLRDCMSADGTKFVLTLTGFLNILGSSVWIATLASITYGLSNKWIMPRPFTGIIVAGFFAMFCAEIINSILNWNEAASRAITILFASTAFMFVADYKIKKELADIYLKALEILSNMLKDLRNMQASIETAQNREKPTSE